MAVGSRLKADGAGRDLVAADVTVGAGFGTTATAEIASGSNDSRGRISVTSGGTGQAQATATVAVAFTEAYDEIPVVVCVRDHKDEGTDAAATVGVKVSTVSTTGFTLQSTTLPVSGEETGFAYIVVG